jgi:hypothetical protein
VLARPHVRGDDLADEVERRRFRFRPGGFGHVAD